jgi:topoisomerase IA-like protein
MIHKRLPKNFISILLFHGNFLYYITRGRKNQYINNPKPIQRLHSGSFCGIIISKEAERISAQRNYAAEAAEWRLI